MEPPSLETPRLRLRALRREDAADLVAPWSDAETLRYWHRLWGIRSREATGPGESEVRGHVGFLDHVPGCRAPFGYLLRREDWGHGLAAEAARAALQYGFARLRIAGAELWVQDGNHRSARVAEKLGARLRGRFQAFQPAWGRRVGMGVYGLTAAEAGVADPVPDPLAVYGVTPILETTDVAAAVAFYREKLGFHLDWSVGDPPEAAAVSRGDWMPQRATVRFTRVAADPETRSGVLAFGVEDVDRLAEELRAAGVQADGGPVTQPWGLRELDLTDPLGQRLRFFAPAPPASGRVA